MALSAAQLLEIRLADFAVWNDADAQALLESYGAKAVVKLAAVEADLGTHYDETLALYVVHMIRLALPQFAHGGGETTSASDAGSSRSSQPLRIPIGMPMDLIKTTAGQRVISNLDMIPRSPMLCI